MVVRQNQMPYYVPPQQFDPTQWQMAVARQQIRFRQPTLEEVILNLGKFMAVVAVGAAAVCIGREMLFGGEESVRHCSECGRTNHDARNCPLTGPRTRLTIEKTGICSCCYGRFRYTEGHHYAGRAAEKGREMCVPCHFHCGHLGDWANAPINPLYCRGAA
jgi:hypothetical protein